MLIWLTKYLEPQLKRLNEMDSDSYNKWSDICKINI
jgi:hypothetical protein